MTKTSLLLTAAVIVLSATTNAQQVCRDGNCGQGGQFRDAQCRDGQCLDGQCSSGYSLNTRLNTGLNTGLGYGYNTASDVSRYYPLSGRSSTTSQTCVNCANGTCSCPDCGPNCDGVNCPCGGACHQLTYNNSGSNRGHGRHGNREYSGAYGSSGTGRLQRPADQFQPANYRRNLDTYHQYLDNGAQMPGARDRRLYDPSFMPTSYSGASADVRWQSDMTAALNEAQQTGRPLLVSVTADWCTYCQQMKQTTFTDPQFIQSTTGFIPVAVNADASRQLAEQLGVRTLPTTLVVTPDRRIVDRIEGYRSASEIAGVLARHNQ